MTTSNHKLFTTVHGELCVDTVADGKMVRSLERGLYPNQSLLDFAKKCITKESVVIDIGAHIGTFAVPVSKFAGLTIAFEPAEKTLALLRQNIERNHASVSVRAVGLGSAPGSASLLERKAENAGANTLVEGSDIPVTTLDSEIEKANFIKIDVEGMEAEVLAGGKKLLEHSQPVVWFEVNLSQLRSHGTSPARLEGFFHSLGYELYFLLDENKLARVKTLSLLTACIAPGSWLLSGESAPFDIIAIAKGKILPLPCVGFSSALSFALGTNLQVNLGRIKKAISP